MSRDPALAFVVAHYHPRGKLPVHLFNLVRYMATLTERVVFVSTGIAPAEAARLAPHAKVIARDNVGYDFWSYKIGIDALGERRGLARLVLCNDSFLTFDPHQLCTAFLQPVAGPALRGISASRQRAPHVQSYWVAFEHGSLINGAEFARWWGEMTPRSEREDVIVSYELGMSARFAAHGVPVKAAYEPTNEELLIALCRAIERRCVRVEQPPRLCTLNLDAALELNPTHFLWDALAARYAIVKLEFLKGNPYRMDLTALLQRVNAEPLLLRLMQDALEE
ncbi:MAG TPA: rhamnan synthesis F family protein [Burkholderiales bacterium]|nr:rhamnan synthesis F family protein [Burkholderiales bacterium]